MTAWRPSPQAPSHDRREKNMTISARTSRLPLVAAVSLTALVTTLGIGSPASALPGCDVPVPPPACDPPEPAPSGTPVGTVTGATRVPTGIKVTGTAKDPDAPGEVTVQLSVNGTARGSVQTVAGAFAGIVPPVAGRASLCAVAVNRNKGENLDLGCRTLTVVVNPFGHVDVVSVGPAGIRVQGWAIDPDTTAPIAVHLYVDGAGQAVSASVARTDVGKAYPLYGANHGFDRTIPAGPGKHTVCVYGINTGLGANTDLGCTTVPTDPPPDPTKVTLKGHLTYVDDGPTGSFQRPIANAKVELWVRPPGLISVWSKFATTSTDAAGNVSYPTPLITPGATYAIRVFATNDAAAVSPQTGIDLGGAYWTEPGDPGAPIQRRADTTGVALDFSYDFTDRNRGKYFNIAETIRRARAFADARRGDSDPIPRVTVQPSALSTFYNMPVKEIDLTGQMSYVDRAIIHEYAHFLEDHIGAFFPLPSSHNGCTVNVAGFPADSPMIAWMEAFADWFAQAVHRSDPGAGLMGDWSVSDGGTPRADQLEAASCSPTPTVPGNAVENYVAGSLWDLTDGSSTLEPFDTLTGMETTIMQIMDGPLDSAVLGLAAPTISKFRSAWAARGLPLAALDGVLVGNKVPAA
jgi:hypothetical protein